MPPEILKGGHWKDWSRGVVVEVGCPSPVELGRPRTRATRQVEDRNRETALPLVSREEEYVLLGF